MERHLPETFKCLRNISTLVIQITIQTNDSSSSVEINTGYTHLHNRGSNTDNVENVDNAKNWLMMIELVIFGTRKSPIQFGEAYTH